MIVLTSGVLLRFDNAEYMQALQIVALGGTWSML